MSVIEEVRREREDLARVLKKHAGIRKIVEDLYPDSAHFIYELLQNAEDAGATEARFTLSRTGIAFEHNGRPFEPRDIYAITNIGEGTKNSEDDTIGRFGVGFKAVFAYTETPHIWSPTFSFKITDLVLPIALDPKRDLYEKTRFEFPFNNPKKTPDNAYADVEAGLSGLSDTALLFLSHLESISWQIDTNSTGEVLRVQHSESHFEVLKQTGGKTTASSHFLKFEQPVQGLERKRIAIAFELDYLPNIKQFEPNKRLEEQLKIVPSPKGQVFVYFPAEKETSGLRFHMHAPFVPELSRASIKETQSNIPLFHQLATLIAGSLHQIRDLGLLTAEFLAVLPNPQDPVPTRYQCIRSTIVKEMNEQPLTPTHAKSYAPAKQLLQGKASLKELLSEDDIEFLVEYVEEPPQWSIGAAQKNSNVDRFLVGLEIKEWDVEQFVKMLREKAPGYDWAKPDSAFMGWLSGKPVEWHQRLYGLIYKELGPNGDLYRLKNVRIILLNNGTYSIGENCFFPSDILEQDEDLPCVNADIYSAGKSKTQRETAKKFLEEIGVRVICEADQVEAILKKRYAPPNLNPKMKDMKRFIALVEKELDKAGIFEKYHIFKRTDDKWGQPSHVFLDKPFLDTGLSAYYDALGDEATRLGLADSYQNCGISNKRFVKFAEVVGAITHLEITKTSCYSNPQWTHLSSVGGSNHTSPINRDYMITGLEDLLAKPSLEISRLVWRSMSSQPEYSDYLIATYQRNKRGGSHYADSQLVHLLREAAWVPQSNESFVRPAEASRNLLPEGFPFDQGWKWLKSVHFGEDVSKKSEENRHKLAIAAELGFGDDMTLERAKRFVALPQEEQERILAEQERREPTELPEHEPTNPDRRSGRVAAEAVDAQERLTEERKRSVSIGREAVKQEAAQYLRMQYTNGDDEMICQVCKAPLPFKLDDGSNYFEKVEFLPELKKRHYQNYLALCPNHAAMYQHANGSLELMREMFVEVTGNEIEVVLAQKDASIYFTKTHIADLKSVIAVDDVSSLEDEVVT